MTSAVVIGCPVNAFRNVSKSMVADRRASDSVPGTPNLGDEGNPAATAQANRHATESIGRGAGPNHSQQVTPRRLGRVYGDPMTESASPQASASASASVPTPAPAQVGEASVEKVSFAVPGWVRRHRLEAHGIKRGLGAGLMLFGLVVVIGGAGLITAQALGSQSDVLKDNLNSAAGFAGYLGKVDVDYRAMAGFTAIAIAGVFIGTRIARNVSPGGLRKGFAVLLVVVGAAILLRSLLGQA